MQIFLPYTEVQRSEDWGPWVCEVINFSSTLQHQCKYLHFAGPRWLLGLLPSCLYVQWQQEKQGVQDRGVECLPGEVAS